MFLSSHDNPYAALYGLSFAPQLTEEWLDQIVAPIS